MDKSFQKEIKGYNCMFSLDKQTLHITCLINDLTYELFGAFSTDNIPQTIKHFLAQSAQDIFGLIKASSSVSIEEEQLCVSYQIGKKTKYFKLHLATKTLDEKDKTIVKLKQDNQRKQKQLKEMTTKSEETLNQLLSQKKSKQELSNLLKLTEIQKEQVINNEVKRLNQEFRNKSKNDIILRGRGLKYIDGFKGITAIKKLNLSYNKLKSLDGLREIKTIQTLDLQYNHLQNVNGLKDMESINTISLNNNRLTNINGLKDIMKIVAISLQNNSFLKISFLPASLQQLSANLAQLSSFDFNSLPKLKKLFTDSTIKSLFRNLRFFVEIVKI